jgi:hypothetical protein
MDWFSFHGCFAPPLREGKATEFEWRPLKVILHAVAAGSGCNEVIGIVSISEGV